MVWPMVIAALGSAAAGAYGSNQASSAQAASAQDQANAARRNSLMGIQMNEPLRYTGHQALGDINSFFGYNTAPYASAQQLANSQTPLTAKQVMRYIKGGATFDQIAQMGTLGIGGTDGKFIKRLQKAGLSMDQIQQLRSGIPQQQNVATSGSGATGQPGQMNWDAITQAPDYQFQLQQGTKDMGNSFAARGGAASGNALRALSEFNQGLASQGLDKFISRRMNLIDGGSRATNATTNITGDATNSLMNAQQQQGDARASGILGTTNSITNSLQGGLNSWLMNKYINNQGSGYNTNGYTPEAGMGIMPWRG